MAVPRRDKFCGQHVLVVQRGRADYWVSARRVGAVDVNGEPPTVPHCDAEVALLNHRFGSRRTAHQPIAAASRPLDRPLSTLIAPAPKPAI